MGAKRFKVDKIIALKCSDDLDEAFVAEHGFKDYVVVADGFNFHFEHTNLVITKKYGPERLEVRVWLSNRKHHAREHRMELTVNYLVTGKGFMNQPFQTITDEELKGLVLERRI